MAQVIEWAPFRLRQGVSEERLLEASDALQGGFLQDQTGFVRRHLLRTADGGYVDMVVWSSRDVADTAMRKAAESPACSAYFAIMGADHADPGADVAHYDELKVYE